jgi:hypothetical protein
MKAKHLLVSGLIILSVVFLGLQLMKHEMYASGVRVVLMILLIILYTLQVKPRNIYFILFLTFFSLAQLIDFLAYFNRLGQSKNIDYIYFIGNGLNILSYTFLILKVLKGMNIREVITKLPVYIVILVVLDIFCVTIVTDAARGLSIYEYSLEFLYNAVIMSLLTLVVINYIHKVNKKAMNLLIGSIFIVFSETIQLAYFYVLEINALNVLCSLFLVIAFLFLYIQAALVETEELDTFKEHLEA